MSKVTKTTPMLHGHTRVEYEDGTTSIVQRGAPVPTVGVDYAVDEKASEVPAVEREPTETVAENEDESGAPSESLDGSQEEGQQGSAT